MPVIQLGGLTCQRRANFSFWRANEPKGVLNFQTFLLRNAKGNFYTLLLYKKFYIILDNIVIHICIYIVHKQGWINRFLKGEALYVGNHGWPEKKTLVFKWFKKAEVTLETISFWQNISISIFLFSPFLSIKSYQFFKIC